MKKLVFIALAILISFASQAEDDKKVKSSIKDVTVFLQGAQVHRKGYFQVKKGITRIVFEGMTQSFNPNSIQVKGKGDFIILEVSTNIEYPEPNNTVVSTIPEYILKKIKHLEDSVAVLNWDFSEIDNEMSTYLLEREMLKSSGVYKMMPTNDSIAALIDAMNFMRVKNLEINKLLFDLEKKKARKSKEYNDVQKRLTEYKNYNANAGLKQVVEAPKQQIIVTVSSDKTVDGSLDMSYLVYNAGWAPAYDLRADDISSPTKITYKAKVYQNTGVDWKGVNLTLSSVNPNQSNQKPALAPWYINYYQQLREVESKALLEKRKSADELATAPMVTMDANTAYFGNSMNEEIVDAQHISNYTTMTESLTMVEFELKIPYNIKSDGKEHLMAIKQEEIPTEYQYFAVPKLDNDAFLLAKLTDWEKLNLLPAIANIYFDGTYVGQTRINPSVMTDTLDLALGRDRDIFITRKLAKGLEKEKMLKADIVKTYTYEFSIKNNKSAPINIIIEDQMPVTHDEDIDLELTDDGGGELNKKTGTIKWTIDIAPKKYKDFEFTYVIKHDKDQQITMN